MSVRQSSARRKTLYILGGIAAASMALGVLAWMPSGETLQRAEVGRPVLPAFASKTDLISLIMVTTKEEAYHLVRNDDGWVLAEKGSYPVTDAKVQELTEALSHIAFGQPMTRDERKFDRIGLGDPTQDGTGALLDVGDGKGNSFAQLLVGQRDGRSYVRRPDDLQAWEVQGALIPPLQRATAWLDLDVVRLAPNEIAGADVRPGQGPAYRLEAAADGGFVLAPPHDRRQVIAALAPVIAAEALTRFSPVDVAPAAEIAVGAPVGSHVTQLNSGVAVVVQAWRARERGWVTISAATVEGANAEASARAAEINAKAAAWAYGLTELDWSVFTTPLDAIAE
jgi:hypothetical protein